MLWNLFSSIARRVGLVAAWGTRLSHLKFCKKKNFSKLDSDSSLLLLGKLPTIFHGDVLQDRR